MSTSKTADIEWQIALVLEGGPLTLAEMEDRLPPEIRAVDRRWIGVAVHQMLRDGRIRTTGCDNNHNHDGACVVEAVQ